MANLFSLHACLNIFTSSITVISKNTCTVHGKDSLMAKVDIKEAYTYIYIYRTILVHSKD